jgi:hypothetical protein
MISRDLSETCLQGRAINAQTCLQGRAMPAHGVEP